MKRPFIFVTRQIPQIGLELLHQFAQVAVWPQRLPPPYETLVQQAEGCDGLLCLITDRIDAQLIDKTAASLKVISQMAVGVDNIDVAAATTRGIPVGHTPGVLTDATADLAWALLMAAARRVVAGDRFVRTGGWQTWEPTFLLGQDISGATLGVVGCGRIGRALARRAQGFNMRLLYNNRRRNAALEAELGAEYLPLPELLQRSDFVSVHTPLTPATHHLFSREQFAQMRKTAVFINTARGPVVDAAALYWALSSGQIAAAAIDVTDPEPINMDSPLLSLDNLIITPHIGSASQQARAKMAEIAARNLIAGLQGNPMPHCVNPEVQ